MSAFSATCAACGRTYVFDFGRRSRVMNAKGMADWLTSAGWVIVGPPLTFYCDEACQFEYARDVTPATACLPEPGAGA